MDFSIYLQRHFESHFDSWKWFLQLGIIFKPNFISKKIFTSIYENLFPNQFYLKRDFLHSIQRIIENNMLNVLNWTWKESKQMTSNKNKKEKESVPNIQWVKSNPMTRHAS